MFGDNSYTGKDINAIREEIIEFMKQSSSEWSDFNESSIQIEYAEMLAGVADMLCYYLDSQALETFLSTAKQRKNVNSLLSQINYQYTVVGASRGVVTFSRVPYESNNGEPVYAPDRLMIPKFLEIYSTDKEAPRFVVTEDNLLQADMDSISVSIVQGSVVQKFFDIEAVRSSFKLYISEESVDKDFVTILNEGYEKVEDAFIEIHGGPKYSVHYDTDGQVYILFTYDWKKYLPREGTIGIQYIQSSGEEGNVPAGKLDSYIKNQIINIDTGEYDNSLTVTNDLATYGGFSIDDVDLNLHKANAKRWIKCHDTIVTLEDFETKIRENSWVRDCVCFDWRKDETIVDRPYFLKAWIVPFTGKETEQQIYTDLARELQKKTVIMNNVYINQAEFYDLELVFDIELLGTVELNKESVRSYIEQEVYDWYSWEGYINNNEKSKVQFGMQIDLNRLIYNIMSLSGAIREVKCVSLDGDLFLAKTQFPYCTSVVVNLV